jgi:hypothetical protein
MPHDVFISYARSDNVVEDGAARGWVSRFHARLEKRLLGITGRAISVYIDEEDHPPDEPLSDIMKTKVQGASVLVCVLSNAFTKRPWTKSEVLTFLLRPSPAVLLAEKLPPDAALRKTLAERIRTLPPTSFWSGKPALEFDDASESYRTAINDLAHRIVQSLPPEANAGPRRRVYVARPADELEPGRMDLERELIDQGYVVDPDDLLADNASLVEARVQNYLKECALSVHLIGREPSRIPAEARTSTIVIGEGTPARREWSGLETLVAQQWRVGSAMTASVPAVVWFPSGEVAADPGQVALVESIERQPKGATVVRGSYADLWQKVRQILEPPPAPPAPVPVPMQAAVQPNPPAAAPAPFSSVYLLSDLSDDEAVADVLMRARTRAYVYTLPKDGSQRDRLQLHAEYLKSAERVLLFWGKASQAWVQKKLIELNKASRRAKRPSGAFLKGRARNEFLFPPGVDVLDSLDDVDRFLALPGGGP